jgi:hypothetical protein
VGGRFTPLVGLAGRGATAATVGTALVKPRHDPRPSPGALVLDRPAGAGFTRATRCIALREGRRQIGVAQDFRRVDR